ncbi:MAG TPA: transposase [Ktedonobacterales bacterium]
MSSTRTLYRSDITDEERVFAAPLSGRGVRRRQPAPVGLVREVVNGLRSIVKTGAPWRRLPHDLSPWPVVSHQMRRWMAAGVTRRQQV